MSYRDSIGNEMKENKFSPIEPGDVHWLASGKGLMHEEIPWEHKVDVSVHIRTQWVHCISCSHTDLCGFCAMFNAS